MQRPPRAAGRDHHRREHAGDLGAGTYAPDGIEGVSVDTNGALTLDGGSGDPVTVTRDKPTPTPGDWNEIDAAGHRRYPSAWPARGRSRIRLPVAAKIALVSAGAIGGSPGSPMPVGAAVL